MKFTNETWYRVSRTFIQALITVFSGLIAQGAFHSSTVTTIISAIVLFVNTAIMNLEEIDNTNAEGYNNKDE